MSFASPKTNSALNVSPNFDPLLLTKKFPAVCECSQQEIRCYASVLPKIKP
ncbi:hypothetical protein QJS04_geneDACA017816 [Acorus gramineus]|uniref:Uncharacterized protein n=1 Tax=Acorus gramineus TaxID=55184 RepID=A0AAV9A3B2_ACOGR|nr:hypothetical protein QJS04_geneDACA017816 [Acorus gramineus]